MYRDLVDLTSRNRKLRMHFARILKRATENATDVLKGLVEAGSCAPAAPNVILVATFWLSFNTVRGGGTGEGLEDLTQGIFQLMMLIAPFLRDAERLHLAGRQLPQNEKTPTSRPGLRSNRSLGISAPRGGRHP